MEKRTRSISKFERKTNTNILGKSNSPCVKRPTKRRRRQMSNYGVNNDEVKKLSIFYGILRRGMMKNIFQKANKIKGGNIEEKILNIIEGRLLSVVFRLRWAKHALSARQLISHCHVKVNGKVVNYSSYIVKPGDIISLCENMHTNPQIIESINNNVLQTPIHLEVAENKFSGKFICYPKIKELNFTFNPIFLSMVEVFSK